MVWGEVHDLWQTCRCSCGHLWPDVCPGWLWARWVALNESVFKLNTVHNNTDIDVDQLFSNFSFHKTSLIHFCIHFRKSCPTPPPPKKKLSKIFVSSGNCWLRFLSTATNLGQLWLSISDGELLNNFEIYEPSTRRWVILSSQPTALFFWDWPLKFLTDWLCNLG